MRFEGSILIVDDDRGLVRALALRCHLLGLQVHESFDSVTALAQIHTQRPNLVCLDVNLPGGNRLSLCEMLCADDRTARIPKIILTGRSDPETIRRCHSMCVPITSKSLPTSGFASVRWYANCWRDIKHRPRRRRWPPHPRSPPRMR